MKPTAMHIDNDSGSGIDEKKVEAGETATAAYRHGDMPADPDEGLSEAEKAAIVSLVPVDRKSVSLLIRFCFERTKNS